MPRRRWSTTDERQYQHIKESEREQGVGLDRAEEIAARTVNKHRRLEGRTEHRRTEGTGNPNTPLAERTRDELYNQAKALRIEGRGRMRKEELLRAIEAKQR